MRRDLCKKHSPAFTAFTTNDHDSGGWGDRFEGSLIKLIGQKNTMKKLNFPYIALGLGLVLMLIVYKGSETPDSGGTLIPLLMLLGICELAFFITGFGAYLGVKQMLSTGFRVIDAAIAIFCALLSVKFMLLGIELWPL